MVNNQRVSRLLRVEHEVFRQPHADRFRMKQLDDLPAVLQIRAGRISEAVSATAIFLMEQICDGRRVFRAEAKLLSHALVPQFRQRFSRLDAKTVEI